MQVMHIFVVSRYCSPCRFARVTWCDGRLNFGMEGGYAVDKGRMWTEAAAVVALGDGRIAVDDRDLVRNTDLRRTSPRCEYRIIPHWSGDCRSYTFVKMASIPNPGKEKTASRHVPR